MNLITHTLTFILYLGCILFLGRLALNIIKPDDDQQLACAWLPIAFILGSASVCLIALPLSILNIKTQPWMILIVIGIVATTSMLLKKKTKQMPSIPWHNYELITFGLFALLLAANFMLTLIHPQFDIDMIGHIIMKAKIISDSSYASAIYFHDTIFATAHNNYPPLTVFLHGFMFLLGLNTMADYQAINYIIVFFLGLTLHSMLRSQISIFQSLLWTFILISTAEYLRGQFLISSTDIFLSLAILVTAKEFLNIKQHNTARDNILFSILCACAMLIKNDAVVFIGLLTISLGIKNRSLLIKHVLILTIILGPWMIFRTTLPDPATGSEHMLKNLNAYISLSNLPFLIQTVMSVLTHDLNRIFLIIPLTWPFVFKNKQIRILMACTIITLFAYIIMIWGMIPLGIKYETPGLMRLWSHVYPLGLFITVLALNTISRTDKELII
jgi:hypothetical protein